MIMNFLNLSKCRKIIFVESWYKLCIVRVLLWVWSYDKTKNWLDERVKNIKIDDNTFRCVRQISILVKVSSRFVPYTTSLIEVLVAEWMLRKVGYSPVLHFSNEIDKKNSVDTRVWLEMDGEIILGNDDISKTKTKI